MDWMEVTHPFTRWVSRSCTSLYDLVHAELVVGMCSACSGDKLTIKEEPLNLEGADEEMSKHFQKETDDNNESVSGQQSPMDMMSAPHSPQGGNKRDSKRVKKLKSSHFTTADRELARSLLHQHNTGVFGSGKWAFGVKDEREKVVDAIYSSFCLLCSEKRRGRVTKGQLKKLLYDVHRQESRLQTIAQELEVSMSHSLKPTHADMKEQNYLNGVVETDIFEIAAGKCQPIDDSHESDDLPYKHCKDNNRMQQLEDDKIITSEGQEDINENIESAPLPTNDCKSESVPDQLSHISMLSAPHSPQGGSKIECIRVRREKSSNFTPADRELARSLLHQYNTGVFGSGKWAFGAKDEREKVVDAIYSLFQLQCSEQRQGSVTKGQLKKLLYDVHRQEARLEKTRKYNAERRTRYAMDEDYRRNKLAKVKEVTQERMAALAQKKESNFCDKCGKEPHSLDQHMKRVHGEYSERTFKCDQPGCSKAYFYILELEKHKRAAHLGGYVCDQCGKSYTTTTRLTAHITKVHKRESLNIKCKYCDKVFNNHSCRRRHHIVVHNVGKGHKCEFCDKKFISPWKRNKHQLSHGEPTFECEQCGKKLVTQYALKIHMRLHTGELFHCPYCPWKGNMNLERHKRTKHKQEYENELAQESLNP